ncbi:hypothetical protein TNCV_3434471 [Trichonephila clavipes]|nr:hypothetical protein TNCV_3434471 [Trichonephila clavipes]
MEKIVSTLGIEKVLQPSSEELTVEPIPRSVALASKRGISWGLEKGLLPTTVIYVNGHQGRLKLRCAFGAITGHMAREASLHPISVSKSFCFSSTSSKVSVRVLAAPAREDCLAFGCMP